MNSHPSQASVSFLRTSSLDSATRGIVESVALISTGTWQDFPLILILFSFWLFKGVTGSSLPKNPLGSHQLLEKAIRGPASNADIETFKLAWKDL